MNIAKVMYTMVLSTLFSVLFMIACNGDGD